MQLAMVLWCFSSTSHQSNTTYTHVSVFTTYNNAWIRNLFLTLLYHIINLWKLHDTWDNNCIRLISCNKWPLYTASEQTEAYFNNFNTLIWPEILINHHVYNIYNINWKEIQFLLSNSHASITHIHIATHNFNMAVFDSFFNLKRSEMF